MALFSKQENSHALLDLALEIANEELVALRAGEVDEAAECFEERSELMDRAFSLGPQGDISGFRSRLLALQALQTRLQDVGNEQREILRSELSRSKVETRRMHAYHKCVRQGLWA